MVNIPVKDHDALELGLELNHARSDGDVVEETETHVLIRFCMVTRWAYDSEGVSYFSFGDRQASFYHASTTQLGSHRCRSIDIKR